MNTPTTTYNKISILKNINHKRNNNNNQYKNKLQLHKKAHNHLIQNSVVNLSYTPLPKPTTNLLSKGLKFIPSPNPTHYNTVYQSFLNYRRNMHMKYFFRKNTPTKHPFKTTSRFTPPQPDNSNLMEYISLVYHDLKTQHSTQQLQTKHISHRPQLHQWT